MEDYHLPISKGNAKAPIIWTRSRYFLDNFETPAPGFIRIPFHDIIDICELEYENKKNIFRAPERAGVKASVEKLEKTSGGHHLKAIAMMS